MISVGNGVFLLDKLPRPAPTPERARKPVVLCCQRLPARVACFTTTTPPRRDVNVTAFWRVKPVSADITGQGFLCCNPPSEPTELNLHSRCARVLMRYPSASLLRLAFNDAVRSPRKRQHEFFFRSWFTANAWSTRAPYGPAGSVQYFWLIRQVRSSFHASHRSSV